MVHLRDWRRPPPQIHRHHRHPMLSPTPSLQIAVGKAIAAEKKKKPIVDASKATVISDHRGNRGGTNGGNSNANNPSSLGAGGFYLHHNRTGENNLEQQEMNDIQVRVINDHPKRNNDVTAIEVAMASPEDENLPPPAYVEPRSISVPVSSAAEQSNVTTTAALVNETNENGAASNANNADEVPREVKISNL